MVQGKKYIERVGKEVRNLGLGGGEKVSLFNRVVQMGLKVEETYPGKEGRWNSHCKSPPVCSLS